MATFDQGDVVCGYASGRIRHLRGTSTIQVLDTEAVAAGLFEVHGLAFDSAGRLYASIAEGAGGDPIIERFSNAGVSEGQWNVFDFAAENLFPWGICTDSSDNVFVICTADAGTVYEIVKLDSSGALVDRHEVEHSTEAESNQLELFIDVACDGTTIYYTDGYYTIFAFDFDSDTQLANFEELDPDGGLACHAIKLISDGRLVVALSEASSDAGPYYGVVPELDFEHIWTDRADSNPIEIDRYLTSDGSYVESADAPDDDELQIVSMASYVPFATRCPVGGNRIWGTVIGGFVATLLGLRACGAAVA